MDTQLFIMQSGSFAEQNFPKSSASSEIHATLTVNHETSGNDR